MSSKITEFMKSNTGAVLVSVILGLGLAALFRKSCNDNNCIIVQGPPLKDTDNKVFSFGDKCYTYKPAATHCKEGDNNVPVNDSNEDSNEESNEESKE